MDYVLATEMQLVVSEARKRLAELSAGPVDLDGGDVVRHTERRERTSLRTGRGVEPNHLFAAKRPGFRIHY